MLDGLEFSKRHIFAARLLKPFWQLNSCLNYAVVTVLRDVTPSSALSKNSEIFLGHEQAMLRQLWHLVFQVIHCFRTRDMIGQMLEQVP